MTEEVRQWKGACRITREASSERPAFAVDGVAHIVVRRYDSNFSAWFGAAEVRCDPVELEKLTQRRVTVWLDAGGNLRRAADAVVVNMLHPPGSGPLAGTSEGSFAEADTEVQEELGGPTTNDVDKMLTDAIEAFEEEMKHRLVYLVGVEPIREAGASQKRHPE